MINVWRVKARVESGGHDVPEEKIVIRYDRALALVKNRKKDGSKPFNGGFEPLCLHRLYRSFLEVKTYL